MNCSNLKMEPPSPMASEAGFVSTRGILRGAVFVVLIFFVQVPSAFSQQTHSFNRSPGWPGSTVEGLRCSGEAQGYGPYDYLTEKQYLTIVENHHFTAEIQNINMIRGSFAHAYKNVDYTLRAFPNHHKALWARVRLYFKRTELGRINALNQSEVQREYTAPECYFQRAKTFNPRDGMVPAIYGIYLHKRGKIDAALDQYKLAEQINPNDAELLYNTGLLYFHMGETAIAQEYADKAEGLGYPLRGLKRMIGRLNTERNAQ